MMDELNELYIMVATVIMQALGKFIPKEPVDRCMFKECPTCGNVEIEYCNYCPDCGQALVKKN